MSDFHWWEIALLVTIFVFTIVEIAGCVSVQDGCDVRIDVSCQRKGTTTDPRV